MATRSELFHAQEQRHRSKTAKKRAKDHEAKKGRTKRSDQAHENVRAAKHASVALEPRPKKGRPSRKSTRKSANRAKSDITVSELRSVRRQAAPQRRHKVRK
jgi:hypothetical protein